MGTNLAILLGHSLAADEVVELPRRVASSVPMRKAAEQLWQVMRPRWENLGSLEEFSTCLAPERLSSNDVTTFWERDEDLPSLRWAGFSLYFGRRAVAAIHLEKFSGFVLDLDELRNPLQKCAEALALEVGSPKVVYGPDSNSPFQAALSVEEGGSLEELLSTAHRLCGDPVRSVRDIAAGADELDLRSNCYYVESLNVDGR